MVMRVMAVQYVNTWFTRRGWRRKASQLGPRDPLTLKLRNATRDHLPDVGDCQGRIDVECDGFDVKSKHSSKARLEQRMDVGAR